MFKLIIIGLCQISRGNASKPVLWASPSATLPSLRGELCSNRRVSGFSLGGLWAPP